MLLNVISYFGCLHLLHKQAETHPHTSQLAGHIHLCYQATSLSYQNKLIEKDDMEAQTPMLDVNLLTSKYALSYKYKMYVKSTLKTKK